jgi:hypothetical protein
MDNEELYAKLVTQGYTDDLLEDWVEAHSAPLIAKAARVERARIAMEVRGLLGNHDTYRHMDDMVGEVRAMEKIVQYVADQIETR